MHIRPTQVQRPGNIVERRHQHPVGMLFAQSLADTSDLVASALSRIFQRIDHHRILWNGRTIFPDQFQGIEVRAERDAVLLTQVGNQVSHLTYRTASSVDGHLAPVLLEVSAPHDLLAQPRWDGGCTLHLQFHQLEFRPLQLLLSRQEIARVSPEGSRGQRHHSRTCRTVEVTDPLTTLPMVGHIFTLMGVGTGEDASRQMLASHRLTEVLESLINIHFIFVLQFRLYKGTKFWSEFQRIN